MAPISRPEILKTLTKLEALSSDMRDLLDGKEPDPMRLLAAPLLDSWAVIPAPFYVMVGNVTGHPKLPDGEVVTSQLFLIEEGKHWARTFSRYYRLGEHMKRT